MPKVLRSESRNGWGKPLALHNLPSRQLHADPLKRFLFWFLLVLIRKKKGGGRIDNQTSWRDCVLPLSFRLKVFEVIFVATLFGPDSHSM